MAYDGEEEKEVTPTALQALRMSQVMERGKC